MKPLVFGAQIFKANSFSGIQSGFSLRRTRFLPPPPLLHFERSSYCIPKLLKSHPRDFINEHSGSISACPNAPISSLTLVA